MREAQYDLNIAVGRDAKRIKAGKEGQVRPWQDLSARVGTLKLIHQVHRNHGHI